MRYTEMLSALNATWREQPKRVRAIAARYYIGAETAETLQLLTEPQYCVEGHTLSPLLTEDQRRHIVLMR